MVSLIADDHHIVRIGITLFLQRHFSTIEIDEAADGLSVLKKIKERDYDFVILDIHMPDASSLQFIKLLLQTKPRLRIIVLSYLPEEVFGIHYIKAGAMAYINKKYSDNILGKAVHNVLSNNRYLTESIKLQLEDLMLREQPINPFNSLSEREMEVLHLLLQGLSITEITQKIHLQHSTVSTYKTRIFEKMNTSNIIELNELASLYDLFPQRAALSMDPVCM